MDIKDIKKICVVGSGTMGPQIAMQCALNGYNVMLNDIADDLLNNAMNSNKSLLERRVQKGKMSQQQADEALNKIKCSTSLEKAASEADFAIEAVFEKIDVKRDVFSRLDEICPSRTIFATNSSYFGNSILASSTNRADKCINMHFFSQCWS